MTATATPTATATSTATPTATVASGADAEIVAALRRGDEQVFTALVERYHSSLVHVAYGLLHDRAAAEDVAQEAWLALLRGIDRFEQRSSLRTWLFRILVNLARGRSRVDRRVVPFSVRTDDGGHDSENAADVADRLVTPAGWSSVRTHLDEMPEDWASSRETVAAIHAAIDALPTRQRVVVQLRDVEGLPPEEVCDLLGVSVGNQRVLLHRGRAKLREELAYLFAASSAAGSSVRSTSRCRGTRVTAMASPTASQPATT